MSPEVYAISEAADDRSAPAPGPVGVHAPDTKPATFDCSMTDRWVETGARLGVGLAGAAVVMWGAYRGAYGAFATAAMLGGPFFWVITPRGWRSAWRAVVSDEYIEATRCGGMRVRLAWDGVGEVQHRVKATIHGPVRLVRLVSIDRQGEIIFSDRWPRFEELMGLVEAHVRHVPTEEATSWRRFLGSKRVATLGERSWVAPATAPPAASRVVGDPPPVRTSTA